MTTAYPGYGSKLYVSLDNVTFTQIAQLRKFSPAGSKQTMVDQTTLRSPGPFTQPAPVQVDSGEFEFDGFYLSGDVSQTTLGQLHGELQYAYFKAVLTDGTTWLMNGYVSEFTPWDVTYNKAIPFKGKLRVAGGITPPTGPQI